MPNAATALFRVNHRAITIVKPLAVIVFCLARPVMIIDPNVASLDGPESISVDRICQSPRQMAGSLIRRIRQELA